MIIEIGTLKLQVEGLTYMAEILVAEMLFLYSFEKRDKFVLRFILLSLFALILSSFVQVLKEGSILIKFSRFLLIILMSIGVMLLSFKGNSLIILSACTAGIATQHFAVKLRFVLELLFGMNSWFSNDLTYQVVSELVIFGITYIAMFFLFARPAANVNYKKNGDARLGVLSAIIVIMCIGINRFAVDSLENINNNIQLAAGLYAMVCCVFALVIQFNLNRWNIDKTELQIMKRMFIEEKKQYEQWKSSIDLVNIRYHDIKHMLTDIKEIVDNKGIDCPNLSVIEQAVNDFTSHINTGNDVLDVMLGNMSEFCRSNNIQFSCMANAQSLKKADGMELYSLFCNAIDNAVDSVRNVTDDSKRIIDLTIREFGDSVIIHIWNYYSGEIRFRGGLPVPDSDGDSHGFGMKSMQMVVERAGGTMSAYTSGEIFNLDIILPSKRS